MLSYNIVHYFVYILSAVLEMSTGFMYTAFLQLVSLFIWWGMV